MIETTFEVQPGHLARNRKVANATVVDAIRAVNAAGAALLPGQRPHPVGVPRPYAAART